MDSVGYVDKLVWQKLEFKAGQRVLVVDEPKDYSQIISGHPDVHFVNSKDLLKVDMLHVFAIKASTLSIHFTKYSEWVVTGGVVWVSWPKKISNVETDITEQTLRDIILPLGWVDTKVCAVSATWSGLKFLRRKK
ncbi:MAG: DUF3052 domain-containing protein [Patescibacteria group bacterium]